MPNVKRFQNFNPIHRSLLMFNLTRFIYSFIVLNKKNLIIISISPAAITRSKQKVIKKFARFRKSSFFPNKAQINEWIKILPD